MAGIDGVPIEAGCRPCAESSSHDALLAILPAHRWSQCHNSLHSKSGCRTWQSDLFISSANGILCSALTLQISVLLPSSCSDWIECKRMQCRSEARVGNAECEERYSRIPQGLRKALLPFQEQVCNLLAAAGSESLTSLLQSFANQDEWMWHAFSMLKLRNKLSEICFGILFTT